jgi:hypothetical protein
VPGFRLGVPAHVADLHAFALGLLDEADLDLWLRACLALDWRGARPPWQEQPGQVAPVPTLGLLQPLAHGFAPADGRHDAPKRAMEPDWAGRLAAGQVRAVHDEAVARLRQAGWQAVPFQPPPHASGVDIAAALVPRCRDPQSMMRRYLAVRLRDDPADGASAESGNDPEALPPRTTELAKELA